MTDLSVDQILAAAKRGAVAIASDPDMRHYSPDTLGLVYDRTVKAMAGAGSLENVARRLGSDPALAAVPVEVVDRMVGAAVKHFAHALAEAKA